MSQPVKVLIVCSGNANNFDLKLHQAFIFEQIEEIKNRFNIIYDVFIIEGKGLRGYLKNLPLFKKKVKEFNPDLIHSHYGLSGFVSLFVRKRKKITTFHGSDINIFKNRFLSLLVHYFSHYSIFVAEVLYKKLIFGCKKRSSVIPCGIDLRLFVPKEKIIAKKVLNLNINEKFILFPSSSDNKIKNFTLAKESLKKINKDVTLLELSNKTREEVCLILNACELMLLTSLSEGSPQIIKEAMACNCPIVVTDVGDIREVIGDTEGCYITTFEPNDVEEKIKLAIEFAKTKGRTSGREKILHFDNKIIAGKVYEIYKKVLNI